MERTEFEKVRASVKEQCGNRVEIRLDRGRNKVEIQTGVIKEAYPSVFILFINRCLDRLSERIYNFLFSNKSFFLRTNYINVIKLNMMTLK